MGVLPLRYQSMTEREKTDFNRGDANNEHYFKRGLVLASLGQAQKKSRIDNQPELNKLAGTGNEYAIVFCFAMIILQLYS